MITALFRYIKENIVLSIIVLLLLAYIVWINFIARPINPSPTPPEPIPVAAFPHIEGAEQPIPYGDMARLHVIAFEAPPAKLKTLTTSWKVLDGETEKNFGKEGTDTIYFCANKDVDVFCLLSYVTEDYNIVNNLLKVRVKVGNGPQPPPVPPTPVPPVPVPPTPVPPVFPDGKYKLAQFSYKTAQALVAPSSRRVQEAQALVNSINGVAAAIAAGTVETLEDGLKLAASSNKTALNSVSSQSEASWQPFGEALQEKLFEVYSNRTMNSITDFRTALLEISEGLSKVN